MRREGKWQMTNDTKKVVQVVHSLSWPPTCLGQSYHPNLKWSPRNPGGAPQRATIDWKFGIIQKCTSFTKIFPSTNKNVSNLWQLDKQDSWFIVLEHLEHQPSWVLLSRLSCPSQDWGVKDGTLEVVDMSNKPRLRWYSMVQSMGRLKNTASDPSSNLRPQTSTKSSHISLPWFTSKGVGISSRRVSHLGPRRGHRVAPSRWSPVPKLRNEIHRISPVRRTTNVASTTGELQMPHLRVGGPRGNQNREPSEINESPIVRTTKKIVVLSYVSSYVLSRSESMTMLVAQLGKTNRETHWPSKNFPTNSSKKCGMIYHNLAMDPRLQVVREIESVFDSSSVHYSKLRVLPRGDYQETQKWKPPCARPEDTLRQWERAFTNSFISRSKCWICLQRTKWLLEQLWSSLTREARPMGMGAPNDWFRLNFLHRNLRIKALQAMHQVNSNGSSPSVSTMASMNSITARDMMDASCFHYDLLYVSPASNFIRQIKHQNKQAFYII